MPRRSSESASPWRSARARASTSGPDADEGDDERVALDDGPVLDRDELGDRAPQRLELPLDELRGNLGLGVGHLEAAPVGKLRLRLHRDRRGEAEALVRRGGRVVA